MKRKLIAGTLALVPLTLVAIWAFGSGTAYEGSARMYSVSAPQNSFGFAEAIAPSYDIAEPAPIKKLATPSLDKGEGAARSPGSPGQEGVPPASLVPGLPKIAYTYAYGYRIAADEISALQRRHADHCEAQGPRVCRILSLQQSGDEGDYTRATLELAVAAPRARKFGAELAEAVKQAGGKEISSSISGEDLSKSIVDTEARLRARTLLRDRLMEVLATRRGTVTELVEAERGVAQVNEEIDEARSWLTEMQGRVEFSRVSIGYAANSPSAQSDSGFVAPIRTVFDSLGAIFGTIIALLIGFAAIVGPFGLAGWLGWKLWQRIRPMLPKGAEPELA